MSDTVFTAVVGFLGLVIGAIASPFGKDWVARRASEREAAAAAESRKRQLYDDLRAALESWRAVSPFVAYNSSKAAEQFAAQERVRALGPQVEDDLLRRRLVAVVAGDEHAFEALHGLAVERLAEVVREEDRRS